MKFTHMIRGKFVAEGFKNWIHKKDKVLDVGCGDGHIAVIVKRNFGCRIEGTDILNFLEVKIPFKIMKQEDKLPYKNKSFDIAMIIDALHHVPYDIQINLLKEVLRVSERVLIFETKPTFMAYMIDHILNIIINSKMPVLLTHRHLNDWLKIFRKMKLKTEYRKLKKPFYYPLDHFAFKLEK